MLGCGARVALIDGHRVAEVVPSIVEVIVLVAMAVLPELFQREAWRCDGAKAILRVAKRPPIPAKSRDGQ